MTITNINERQHARLYIYKKGGNFKTFLYYKKLFNKQEILRYVYLKKKLDTILYAKFHEFFEIGICIQKALHFVLRGICIYKKQTFLKNQDNLRSIIFVQKS